MVKRQIDTIRSTGGRDAPHKKTRTASSREESAYTTQQKAAIGEFTGVTQSDKTTAGKVLRQHNWNVSSAINAYFNASPAGAHNLYRGTLNRTFDKYRDDAVNEPDEINVEGTGSLLGDMEIGLDDIGALVFSELVQSPSLGKVTRDGFVDGWSDVNVDTIPKMRDLILQRRSSLGVNKELFKNVYNHTFPLALAPGAKTLPLEMAIEFWRMLFSDLGFEWRSAAGTPWLDWWLEFLQAKNTKAVNKDLWKQTLNFAKETIKDDSLSFWSEDSSWPSVIDEFVGWVKEEKRPTSGESGGGGDDTMEIE